MFSLNYLFFKTNSDGSHHTRISPQRHKHPRMNTSLINEFVMKLNGTINCNQSRHGQTNMRGPTWKICSRSFWMYFHAKGFPVNWHLIKTPWMLPKLLLSSAGVWIRTLQGELQGMFLSLPSFINTWEILLGNAFLSLI